MKRIIAALFGLTIAAAVLTAPPAMADDVQISGYVTNQDGIFIDKGLLAFFASCEDAQNFNSVADIAFDDPFYQVTLPAGQYLVRIVPEPGSFGLASWNEGSLTCEGATAIDVKPGSTFHVVSARNGTLTVGGVQSDRGAAVFAGEVLFFASCKDYRNFEPAAVSIIDGQGASYRVTLPAGDYRALIQPNPGQGSRSSWHNSKSSCLDAQVITVPEIQYTQQGAPLPFNVDLKSQSITEVSGTADSPKGPILLGDIQFYASCDAYQDGDPTSSSLLDNGTYTTELPAGTYRVRIVPFDNSGALESWHDKAANCAGSTPVTIKPDPSQTLEPLHARAGVILTGSVTSSNGPVTVGGIDFRKTCSSRTYFTNIDNGNYTVVVPSGDYRAFISADTGTGAVNSWHSNAQSCANATVVDATVDANRPLVARAGFEVSGSVSTTKGTVNDGSVTFYKTCDDAEAGESVGSSSLNAGTYDITLPNGTYKAFIEPNRGQGALESWHNASMSCDQATNVTVNGTTTANLRAAAGSNVSGIATNGTDQVNAGNVWFYANCETGEGGDLVARSDLKPDYSLTVPNGNYRVLITPGPGQRAIDSWHSAKPSCDQATPVTVSGDTTINLVATRGSQISGDVTSSAGPLDAGSVEFYTDCEAFKNENPTSRTKISSGTYSLTVPNGSYRVRLYTKSSGDPTSSWHSAKNSCAQATVVNVTGDNSNVDLVAKLASPVDGNVTRNGNPIRFGTVQFFATCEDFVDEQVAGRAEIQEGIYQTDLPDGKYFARIRQFAGDGVSFSWHNAAGSCAQATEITVAGPTQADLIARPTSFITGTVTGPSAPLDRGVLEFFATCTDYQQDNPAAVQFFEDGTYESRLPDGTYLTRISPDQDGVARSWHNAKNSCEQANAVTISGPGTRNLVAAAGSVVSGTVSSTAGLVKGGDLTFYASCNDERTNRAAGYAQIRSNGYSLRIVPGTYRVEIDPNKGFGAKFSWHSAKASCADSTPVTVTADGTLNIVASAKTEPTPDPTTPPPPTPTPDPTVPVPSSQSVKKPPAKLKKGKKAKLAPKTAQGARLKWTTSTKKVCVVKKTTVTAKKKGACKLSAKAPAVSGFNAFTKRYTIRVQ